MSPDPCLAAGHREVLRLLEDASLVDPNGGHRAIVSGDILAASPGCDALITEVSSVALDFLHLRHGPLFVAGRYDDRDRLHARSPLSRCADVANPVPWRHWPKPWPRGSTRRRALDRSAGALARTPLVETVTVVSFVMTERMLRGIRDRAEGRLR